MEIIGSLRIIAKTLIPALQVLKAQRDAVRNPNEVFDKDVLDDIFNRALINLGAIEKNEAWWRSILNEINVGYVTTEYFKHPYVVEWLSDGSVKDNFKILAREKLIGNKIKNEAEILTEIKGRYSQITGNNSSESTCAIDSVLAVLQVTAYASLSPGEVVILKEFSKLKKELKSEDPLHGKVLKKELDFILRRRGILGVNSREEIENLIQRLYLDLNRSPILDRAEVYYWAAQFLATKKETISKAVEYLENYKSFPNAEFIKVNHVQALMDATNGNTREAIQILSELDTSDTRASIFDILRRVNANDALDWLKTNKGRGNSLLSAYGWHNVVVTLIKERDWHGAIELLEQLTSDYFNECPELLFDKGVVYASFLLPESIRPNLLGLNMINYKIAVQEGFQIAKYRKCSIKAFTKAKNIYIELKASDRVLGCDYHLFWLQLSNPDTSSQTLVELKDRMKDVNTAMSLLDIALSYDDTFDPEPIIRLLRRRRIEGRQNSDDLKLHILLLKLFGREADLITFFNDEFLQLEQLLTEVDFASIRIEVLLIENKSSEAKSVLSQKKDQFTSSEYERLRLLIASSTGEELQFPVYYDDSADNFENLLQLVKHLEITNQWHLLQSHSKILLKRQHTVSNLLTHIRAIQISGVRSEEIISCIEEHKDLLEVESQERDELLTRKALALFYLGKFVDAYHIIANKLSKIEDPESIRLEINLVLRLGQWEKFVSIVDREFSKIELLPTDLLLQMGSIIAFQDTNRTMELIEYAASREPQNAEIQACSYLLAVQIGRESEAGDYLKKATSMSNCEDGPFYSVSIRDVIESIPARSKQRSEWIEKYLSGKISVYEAAFYLNVPVAELLIGTSLTNRFKSDSRYKLVIPFRHGVRKSTKLTKLGRIAFDMTSLMVLENIDILKYVFENSDKIILSQKLMDVLFIEHRQARFHQPSIVERALRIRELIDKGDFHVLENSNPPQELIEEVGMECASLIHEAFLKRGRFVTVLPVCKAGTFGEQVANLGKYSEVPMKMTQLVQQLKKYISVEEYNNSIDFLESVDRFNYSEKEASKFGPLYISDSALDYLDAAGLLNRFNQLNQKIYIEDSTYERFKLLVTTAKHGDKVAKIIDNLRIGICEWIKQGKVEFLSQEFIREHVNSVVKLDMISDLISNIGNFDFVCIDDRALGRYRKLKNKNTNTVPIIDSFDILQYLSSNKIISREKRESCEFKLRKWGYFFLPIQAKFIFRELTKSYNLSESKFVENGNLKCVRENLQLVRSMEIISYPEETNWYRENCEVFKKVLKKIWLNENIDVESTCSMSDWLFNALSPFPLYWWNSDSFVDVKIYESEIKLNIANIINQGIKLINLNRHEEYAMWVEQRLLRPLLIVNLKFIDQITKIYIEFILDCHSKIIDAEDVNQILLNISILPESIKTRIYSSEIFIKLFGDRVLYAPYSDVASSLLFPLLNTVRNVYQTKNIDVVKDLKNREIEIGLDSGIAKILRVDTIKVDDQSPPLIFGLLSPEKEIRLNTLQTITRQIGATGPDELFWKNKLESGPISNEDAYQFHVEVEQSFPFWKSIIERKIQTGKMYIEDLIPNNSEYFTRLCGPLPNGMCFKEYINGPLKNHRDSLIERNMLYGLSLILPGSLHSRISIPSALEKFSSDEIWNIVNQLKSKLDPFTMLGLIEIALAHRFRQPKLNSIASVLIEKLCNKQLLRPDKKDVYEYFPKLVELTIDRIQSIENINSQPPYWQWLCAFTHAGMLTRILNNYDTDTKEFNDWLKAGKNLRNLIANTIQIRHSPTWRVFHVNREHIQAEILGRLKFMQVREEQKGLQFPNVEMLESRTEELMGFGYSYFRAGPMEGHLRPMDYQEQTSLTKGQTDVINQLLSYNVKKIPWTRIEEASTYLYFTDQLRKSITNKLTKIKCSGENFEEKIAPLGISSFIASTYKDRAMADAIANKVIQEYKNNGDLFSSSVALLILSTAVDDSKWVEWLSNKWLLIARNTSRKTSLKDLFEFVYELKSVVPVHQWKFNKIEGLCNLIDYEISE